jgi:hypothetical protein
LETAACQDYELGNRGIRILSCSGVGSCSRELRKMAVEVDYEKLARKELRDAKKASCVLQ